MSIPVIDITGGPGERGESHGKQAAEQIARAVAHYRADFASKGVEWDDACQIAGEFRKAIEAFDADLASEIEAIAHGAGQDVNAIVLLNARTEVLFWREKQHKLQIDTETDVEGCTSAVVLPEATSNGQLLHGQNWDWRPEVAEHTIALRIRDQQAPDALHLVEAGQLARHGLNDAGIAVTAMGLHSGGDYGRLGIPSPVIRRRILQAESYGAALGEVFRNTPSFSHALIISDARGEAFCLETTPDETFWLAPENGVITHANHFKHPAALIKVRDANLSRCPDSLYRDSRVFQHLERARGSITADTLESCFSDRFGAPDSVLRHPAKRPSGLVSATVYTLIMSPGEGRVHVALRPYQGAGLQEISLN